MPNISIITVNYNNASGLRETIKSVLAQDLAGIEYVVIDGASTDGSPAILKEYESDIAIAISEPDSGVYQAMNKGIRAASGDYLLFLNSGDTLYNNTVLDQVKQKLVDGKDIYYGHLYFRAEHKSFIREYPKKLQFSHFIKKSLPHPATFIKRSLFDHLFYYSEEYKIVSDWEFFVYAICKAEVSYQQLDIIVSNFDLEGMSNDPKNSHVIKKERNAVLQKHFPAYYQDYQELMNYRSRSQRKDLRLLRQIQESKNGSRLLIRVLKLLSVFFGTKAKEEGQSNRY